MQDTRSIQDLQDKLLNWYDRHRRVMPWRAQSGQTPDPYHVWLSEIMLQQTTVTAVKPYFEKFIARWPNISDLAAADQGDVMEMWAGLGYYARARNLHKCAKVVMDDHDGRFPQNHEVLLTLPGIGPYTAAAIASIAFNQNYTAVDGNVERVVVRLDAMTSPLSEIKPKIKKRAEKIGNNNPRPSDFTQAFMELGATVCTPQSPKCGICPWQSDCKAFAKGIANDLPKRKRKKAKPKRKGTVHWIEDRQGRIATRRRPENGLLGGMMEFPSYGWDPKQKDQGLPRLGKYIGQEPEEIRHVFTHFELTLTVQRYQYTGDCTEDAYQWYGVDDLNKIALPSVMKKVVKLCTS